MKNSIYYLNFVDNIKLIKIRKNNYSYKKCSLTTSKKEEPKSNSCSKELWNLKTRGRNQKTPVSIPTRSPKNQKKEEGSWNWVQTLLIPHHRILLGKTRRLYRTSVFLTLGSPNRIMFPRTPKVCTKRLRSSWILIKG